MNENTIHDFMREKGLKAAVAILLAAAIGSPAAVGALTVVFALSTLTLTRLLRPSKWPRLSAWPCWTWGTTFYMVLAFYHAWFYAPAPDILTCDPVGELHFCWEWLWLKSRIPAGAYLLLVAYDYLQYCDFCAPGTEVLMTRITEFDQGGLSDYSVVVHSNVELTYDQWLVIMMRYGWRCLEPPSMYWGVGGKTIQLCLMSVRFDAEPDGTRTRGVSKWTSPNPGQPVEFSYYRPMPERIDLHLSQSPLATGLLLFTLREVLFMFECDDFTKVVGLSFLVGMAWLTFGRAFDSCLHCWLVFARAIDGLADWLCGVLFEHRKACMIFLIVCVSTVLVTVAAVFYDERAAVRAFVHLALACVVLRIVAGVPILGKTFKFAISTLSNSMRSITLATASAIALGAKSFIAALSRTSHMLFFLVPSTVVGATAVSAAFSVRALVLCVYYSAMRSILRVFFFFLSTSSSRQSAIASPQEARSKYPRPMLAPLAETRTSVEPAPVRGDERLSVSFNISCAASATASSSDRVGRHTKNAAVVKGFRKGGVVLGVMASSVTPLRRSIRLARRFAVGISEG
jgi:hypothetical protein